MDRHTDGQTDTQKKRHKSYLYIRICPDVLLSHTLYVGLVGMNKMSIIKKEVSETGKLMNLPAYEYPRIVGQILLDAQVQLLLLCPAVPLSFMWS